MAWTKIVLVGIYDGVDGSKLWMSTDCQPVEDANSGAILCLENDRVIRGYVHS